MQEARRKLLLVDGEKLLFVGPTYCSPQAGQLSVPAVKPLSQTLQNTV